MTSYLATCPEETISVLVEELEQNGAKNVQSGYKFVKFEASDKIYYKLHLTLSTASNLFTIIKECAATSSKMLHSQAKRIKWSTFFNAKSTYKVDGIAGDRGEHAMSSNQLSKEVRVAIEDHFAHVKEKVPSVNLKDPDIKISVMVYKGRASICINTSGKSLHKRSYRMAGHPAPLKETMAASLLKLIGYDGSQVLYDPMCGSGTIAIEAAFIALNKACNIHRKKGQFSLEHLLYFDKDLWRDVQTELRKQKEDQLKHPIYASDIEQSYIHAAQDNALRARVEKFVDFSTQSFFETKKPSETGFLISNLPYGERITIDGDDLKSFYKKIGDHLKKEYSGWSAHLFVNEKSPWKFIGLKPDKKFSLLNGSIKTKLLVFKLYKGSKKQKGVKISS